MRITDKQLKVLREAAKAMQFAKVFLATREKIHPDGLHIFAEAQIDLEMLATRLWIDRDREDEKEKTEAVE